MHQIKFSTCAFFYPFWDILCGGITIDFSLGELEEFENRTANSHFANMNFLANGCILQKNARKQTPLKIQFYFQDYITLPTSTISKAKKRHCFFFMSHSHSLWLLAGNLLPDYQIALT